MTVIVVVGAILVTTASVNSLFDRRRRDSLERHEQALAALRDLAEHPREIPASNGVGPPPEPATDHVHILSEPPADAAAHRRRVQKTAAARRAAERRRPQNVANRPTAAQLPTMPVGKPVPPPPARSTPSPLAPRPATPAAMPVFIDPPVAPPTAPAPGAPARTPPNADSTARTHAIAVGAAAAVVVIGATSAVLLTDGSGGGPRATSPAPTSVPVAATLPKPTVAPPAPPPDIQAVATAQGDGTVTVAVPFTLTVSATGACWVSVQSDSGQSLFVGTMQTGQQQHVTGTGPLEVRLGNTPAVTISVNGQPLNLAGVARTANVRFVPPT